MTNNEYIVLKATDTFYWYKYCLPSLLFYTKTRKKSVFLEQFFFNSLSRFTFGTSIPPHTSYTAPKTSPDVHLTFRYAIVHTFSQHLSEHSRRPQTHSQSQIHSQPWIPKTSLVSTRLSSMTHAVTS